MFKTYVGPVEDEENAAYLRPETAQAIFAQFKNVLETSRQKVPFGIAQMGKAFRNEVTPRNFTFRSREFEQMELEFFIRPDEAVEAVCTMSGDEALDALDSIQALVNNSLVRHEVHDNVEPRLHTRVTALFDLDLNLREFRLLPKTLHFPEGT